MKSLLLGLLFGLLSSFSPVNAFQVRPTSNVAVVKMGTTTALNVFGNKKTAATREAEAAKAEKYWQGEWVCKDCGYIYNRVRLFYEERNNENGGFPRGFCWHFFSFSDSHIKNPCALQLGGMRWNVL